MPERGGSTLPHAAWESRLSEDLSELREERRIVTALFADMVGSTTLGERLDPEELKLILADAIARVIGAVEAFGGTIKDLAGDGVLALFGAPIAHEDDPERAVRAGLRIVEEIAEFASEVERGWGIEGFGVRVGVDTGPVVTGPIGAGSRVEYTALGDAVNTAARLQSSAEPGTLLVGEETHRLSHQLFEWAEPLELALKGKAQSVRAWRVTGARAAAARDRGLEGMQARMVGRARELASGVESVDAAVAGSGGVLYLVGEPGIGKSRLLAELRSAFGSKTPSHGRSLWLEGRCASYGESMPYLPFRDLLRSWLGAAVDDPELRVRVGFAGKPTACSASGPRRSSRTSRRFSGSRSNRRRRLASQSSRPRPCSTGPSKWCGRWSTASRKTGPSPSPSKTFTGPIRRRFSSWKGSSATRRYARSCSCSRPGRSTITPLGA